MTELELRYEFNKEQNTQIFTGIAGCEIRYTPEYTEWLEYKVLEKVNGDYTSTKQALILDSVTQQRELLNDFAVKLRGLLNFTHTRPLPKYIEFYLKGIL